MGQRSELLMCESGLDRNARSKHLGRAALCCSLPSRLEGAVRSAGAVNVAQRVNVDNYDSGSATFERQHPALDVVADCLIADADIFGSLFYGQVVVCVFHVDGPCASDAHRHNVLLAEAFLVMRPPRDLSLGSLCRLCTAAQTFLFDLFTTTVS